MISKGELYSIDSKFTKMDLVIGLMFLFIISAVTPVVFGYNASTLNKDVVVEDYAFDRYYFPETYPPEKHIFGFQLNYVSELSADSKKTIKTSLIEAKQEGSLSPLVSADGPKDFPWPMHGHDTHHTGRSPYSTADNPGTEKWRFDAGDYVDGSAIIDDNGIIYFGSHDGYFYAIYPNGTQKWKIKLNWNIGEFGSSPVIDKNGVIYVGNTIISSGLYAVEPEGTLKWKYSTGDIATSPAIGNDGTIYFGCEDNNIYALYPNGTLRWKYVTGHIVQSSPAIGNDGTVYCGSHDNYLYALYPNNGTVKWKFPTGGWVHGSPTIGSDDTIYIGSDDGFLYALYLNNGTLKWKCNVGSMRSSPSLDKEGTLYFGVWENRFHAVYPNGTIKWSFDPGEKSGIWGSTAAISDEGTVYFGTCIDIGYCKGGDIIALNPNGTEKWRKRIADDWITSSPCISEDGTVYIGSSSCINGENFGYLHAVGKGSPNAPNKPVINGPRKGKINTNYTYTAVTTDVDGDNISYYFDWGDGTNSGWTSYVPSGTLVSLVHNWQKSGFYITKVKAKDDCSKESNWAILIVKMPKDKPVNFNTLFLKLLEQFPLLQRLSYFLK